MKYQIVTAAIIIKDGKILAMRRAPGEASAGKWEFPGGKLEDNETLEDCLRREMLEELNIQGQTREHICDSVYEYKNGTLVLKAYIFEWTSGEMSLSVHDDLKWLPLNELLNLDWSPADIPIAKKLMDIF